MGLLTTPFYHQLLRRYHIAFGRCFSNLTMLRSDATGQESQRIVVPIEYVPRESWLTRLRSDANIESKVSNVWPKLAYEMTGMRYDPLRKLNSLNTRLRPDANSGDLKQFFGGVPYILTFSLYGIMRSVEDLNQIIEQIVPYFTPDYTLMVNTLPSFGINDQMRLVMDGQPTWTDSFETDNFTRTREIVVTFNFNASVMLYGPTPTSSASVIRKVLVDLYDTSIDATLAGPSYVLSSTYDRLETEDAVGRLMTEDSTADVMTMARAIGMTTVPNPLTADTADGAVTTIVDYHNGTRINPITGNVE